MCKTYQCVLVPCDALLLVGICVGVALDGAGLAAEEAVERGADLVAAVLLEGVALSAPGLEEVGTLLGVTCMCVSTKASCEILPVPDSPVFRQPFRAAC